MNREDYLRNLIINQFKSIRKFAEVIGVPASTITSMLANGVGGTAIDTVIKVCKGLGIKTEDLELIEISNPSPNNVTLAAHRTDGYDIDLPEDAQEELNSYIEFLKMKYKKKD